MIVNSVINKKITINGFDASLIKNKVIQRLENIMDIDKEFSENLENYIKSKYYPYTMN